MLMNSLSAYELNLLSRALNCLESNMSHNWQIAQKRCPYGAMATSLSDEMKEVRKLADRLAKSAA